MFITSQLSVIQNELLITVQASLEQFVQFYEIELQVRDMPVNNVQIINWLVAANDVLY